MNAALILPIHQLPKILLPKTKPIIVGTCYRAPKNKNIIECFESSMQKLKVNCDTLILGDFNICTLKNFKIVATALDKQFLKSFIP